MRIQGISGSRGVAVGNVYRYIQEEIVIPDYNVTEDKVEEEIGKFATAMASTLKQLDTIRKKALDEMIKMLNDNPNVTIELGAHTDRKGSEQYNERLAQRRAQSVVDYLIAGGIDKERLEAKGYGKSVPKVINKKLAKSFDFLNEGDVLTEEFILTLTPEQQEMADQINRRTEFKVLRTTYNLF